ncbi:MAG: DNA polymerase III subunit delta [Chloroflexi bacterium]|nr:DNA polymerase III subunit delta [Chloroflexota bacterium]
MIYIYHGEDDFTRAEALKNLRAQMGDPQFAELNTTVLDGKTLSFGELRHHADAIPFLSAKRLVIVEGMLARLDPRRKAEESDGDSEAGQESNPELKQQLLDYLPRLPPTTLLVFVENKKLHANHAVLKLADKDKKNAQVKLFAAPSADALPDWVIDHVEKKGGKIDFSAANDLALFIGADLYALDSEIEKLILYRSGETIRRDDVRAMVAPAQEQSIFELVDALGQRKTQRALELLHAQLRHNANEFYLLTMIARQYRIMLQVRDLATRGLGNDAIQKQLGLHPFVMKKMSEQARNYSVEQLDGIMHKLLDTDVSLKTSKLEPTLALDLLVVDLTTH